MSRLRVVWAALRGRPVAYRLEVRGTVVVRGRGAVLADCVFTGDGSGPCIRIEP